LKRIRFTQEGYDKLKAEYQDLLKQRPAAVEELKKARDMGDLSENCYYKASRAKLSFIDGQLRKIDLEIKYAIIFSEKSEGKISIGSEIVLANDGREIKYQIVGDLEADPSQGKISLLSPLGRALTNKQVGDEAIIETPAKKIIYKILKIT
jgi:transcription elongation factor GreA